MKGKELFSKIIREEVPDIEQAREKIMREAVLRTLFKKPLLTRLMVASTTAAAILCILIFGSIYLFSHDINETDPENSEISDLYNPQSEHNAISSHDSIQSDQNEDMFTLLAFMTELEDVEANHQIDPESSPDGVLIIKDYIELNETRHELGLMNMNRSDRTIYKFLFIQYDGDSIESVDFSVDGEGFFMKASVPTENGIPPQILNGEELYIPSKDREILGSSFSVFDLTELTEDSMLYVGKDVSIGESLDLNLTIRVVLNFNNGTKQAISFFVV